MYWYFAKHNGEFPVPTVLDLLITTDAAFHSSFLETSSVWLTGPLSLLDLTSLSSPICWLLLIHAPPESVQDLELVTITHSLRELIWLHSFKNRMHQFSNLSLLPRNTSPLKSRLVYPNAYLTSWNRFPLDNSNWTCPKLNSWFCPNLQLQLPSSSQKTATPFICIFRPKPFKSSLLHPECDNRSPPPLLPTLVQVTSSFFAPGQ